MAAAPVLVLLGTVTVMSTDWSLADSLYVAVRRQASYRTGVKLGSSRTPKTRHGPVRSIQLGLTR